MRPVKPYIISKGYSKKWNIWTASIVDCCLLAGAAFFGLFKGYTGRFAEKPGTTAKVATSTESKPETKKTDSPVGLPQTPTQKPQPEVTESKSKPKEMDAIAYNNRGIAYLDKGQYGRAIEDFNKAIALDPNYASAYGNRGFAYQRLRRDAEAEKDFSMARQLEQGR